MTPRTARITPLSAFAVAAAIKRALPFVPRVDDGRPGLQGILVHPGYIGATDGGSACITYIKDGAIHRPMAVERSQAENFAAEMSREGAVFDELELFNRATPRIEPIDIAKIIPEVWSVKLIVSAREAKNYLSSLLRREDSSFDLSRWRVPRRWQRAAIEKIHDTLLPRGDAVSILYNDIVCFRFEVDEGNTKRRIDLIAAPRRDDE